MLEIQTTGSGTVHMAVRGELDMHQAPQMRAAINAVLNRGDVTGVDLDLSAVTVLDATGVGTIIVAHRIATNVRVDLRLTAVSTIGARLLRLTGAEALLPAAPSGRSARQQTPQAGARRAMPSKRSPPAGRAGEPSCTVGRSRRRAVPAHRRVAASGAGPGYGGNVSRRLCASVIERQEAAYILRTRNRVAPQ
ncbi:MAG TPA: STAS domain-containing protein [Actinoplanes sp.]